MKFALPFFVTLAACGTTTPLPGGPPPEYEASPIYGASTASAASAPTAANSPGSAIAGDAGAPAPAATIDPGM